VKGIHIRGYGDFYKIEVFISGNMLKVLKKKKKEGGFNYYN